MIEFMDEDDLMADVDVDSSPPEEVMEIIRSKTGWQDLDLSQGFWSAGILVRPDQNPQNAATFRPRDFRPGTEVFV